VVFAVRFYGQDPQQDRETPRWVGDEPGLRWLSFAGGGRAQGKTIRIPAVWDPRADFTHKYVEPVVAALAARLDGKPHVWYVQAALGHLGNMTVQPSAGGARAILDPASGWSAGAWEKYCREVVGTYRRHFRSAPPLLIDEMMLLRDRDTDNGQQEAARIIGRELAPAGVALVQLQVEGTRETIPPFFRHARALAAHGALRNAERGLGRYGVGDDWPLWVPEKRRDQGGTRGRDEVWLRQAVKYAFGGIEGAPPLPTTILCCQLPETLASHPDAPEFRPEVARAMKEASARLQEQDRQIFGSDN
jgi:hypothetical protein